jgi:excisionase family DNA binding protein
MNKEYLTTTQAAKILGISRMQMLRKVKAGEIKAIRAGRNFLIAKEELNPIFKPATKREMDTVDQGVEKVIKEYGDVLKKLGKE